MVNEILLEIFLFLCYLTGSVLMVAFLFILVMGILEAKKRIDKGIY